MRRASMSGNGISRKVRRMYPTRYTVKEAASLVGRSADTLTRWRQEGVFTPSDSTRMGDLTVHLYTVDDIENLRKIAKTMRPGRPKQASEATLGTPRRRRRTS